MRERKGGRKSEQEKEKRPVTITGFELTGQFS
jgi:hypothetical protein